MKMPPTAYGMGYGLLDLGHGTRSIWAWTFDQ